MKYSCALFVLKWMKNLASLALVNTIYRVAQKSKPLSRIINLTTDYISCPWDRRYIGAVRETQFVYLLVHLCT